MAESLGKIGERIAEAYLRDQGYQILDRGKRLGFGEIDLVAKDGEVLVIVEVKTRSSDDFGGPEQAVNSEKLNRLRRLAEAYANSNRWHGELRVDVIAIRSSGNIPKLKHLKNVG